MAGHQLDDADVQSAFHAAQDYLRQGHKGPALPRVEVAAAYDPLREKAQALRAAIDELRD